MRHISLCLLFFFALASIACEPPHAPAPGSGFGSGASAMGEDTGRGEHFAAANQALIEGDVTRAISHCEQGVTRQERACHRLLGIAYRQKGDHAAACAAFQRAAQSEDPYQFNIQRQLKSLNCAARQSRS